jgi:mRNA interferase MazF
VADDFAAGSLRGDSFIRAGRLFTAAASLIAYRVGRLKAPKIEEVTDAVVRIVRM